jgi:uncharacterized protein (DUF433 family)
VTALRNEDERLERFVRWCRERISVDPRILGSEPTIANTRLAVESLPGFLKAGESTENVLREYPYLTAEDLEFAPYFVEVNSAAHDRGPASSQAPV